MPIIGFKSKKILGERKKELGEFKSEIEIGYEFTILKIEENAKEKTLDVEFRFNVKYEPEVGNLILEGVLTYLLENENDYIKNEKKEIILSKDVYQKISNVLMKMSIIELFNIARSLYLPVPLNLPTVTFSGAEKKEVENVKGSKAM